MIPAPVPLPKRNTRLVLGLFFLVLLGPFLFAYTLIQRGEVHKLRMNNHGDLISPVRTITGFSWYDLQKKDTFSTTALLGKWWFIYLTPPHCAHDCENTLYQLRQIKTALGKNTSRVERMVLSHPHCPENLCQHSVAAHYPEVPYLQISKQDYEQLFSNLTITTEEKPVGTIFVVDPLGQMMMHYNENTPPKGILVDMQRPLKVSKIG